jgi:hypothetical protein
MGKPAASSGSADARSRPLVARFMPHPPENRPLAQARLMRKPAAGAGSADEPAIHSRLALAAVVGSCRIRLEPAAGRRLG